MAKPRVNIRCVANQYAGPSERIVEFGGENGAGGLISLRNMPDGKLVVELYRCDDTVEVRTRLTPVEA